LKWLAPPVAPGGSVTIGLIGSVLDAFTDEQGGRATFGYRCADCGERFERAGERMVAVRCPACRSMHVRVPEAAERGER
jgi:DNA-directed RNA polymerase subunit RPC12/RpoP